jgi:hypothetical protein
MQFINGLRSMCLAAVAIFLFFFLFGCGDENGGGGVSGPVGSAAVSWSLECPDDEALGFIAQVYDAESTYLTYGGPWECTVGSGTVNDIPIGSGHKVVLFAENSVGDFLYRGEKRKIDVDENTVTEVGDITTQIFVTSLEEPEDKAMVGKEFSLRWNYVAGAARYIVEIDSNTDFIDPIIAQTVSGPPYILNDLAGGEYYWKVTCADIYDNQGANSDTWQFTIPVPLAIINYPEDADIFTELRPINFSGNAIDDVEGALTERALVWISDTDGLIGYGESVETFGLSVGTHLITLTATNSIGYSDSDTITITIVPEE